MMLKEGLIFFIAFLVVLFCSTTHVLPQRLTFNPIIQDRILGGSIVPIEQFPYQLSLRTVEGHEICSGSIISEKHVLTSGFLSDFLHNGSVRSGTNTKGDGGSLHNISNIIRHEKYYEKDGAYINDIAILTVEPNFVFDTKQKPINIFMEEAEIPAGQMGTISGYGISDENGTGNGSLMAVSVPTVSREVCTKVWEGLGSVPILEDRFCAGEMGGGKGWCIGDIGGPFVVGDQQVGISSYTFGCAEPNIPAVYTRVAYFSEWIKENTR